MYAEMDPHDELGWALGALVDREKSCVPLALDVDGLAAVVETKSWCRAHSL